MTTPTPDLSGTLAGEAERLALVDERHCESRLTPGFCAECHLAWPCMAATRCAILRDYARLAKVQTAAREVPEIINRRLWSTDATGRTWIGAEDRERLYALADAIALALAAAPVGMDGE